MKKHYIIPIFVPHQGCPNSCVFCNQHSITGRNTAIHMQDIKSSIDSFLRTIPPESKIEVAFYGGSFTCIPEEIQAQYLATAGIYLKQGDIDGIRLSTRPDAIDDHIMEFLMQYGVSTIELGVQSMVPQVLLAAERGHTPEDVIEAVRCIKRYPVRLGLQMMVGLPGEGEKDPILTAMEFIRLEPDFVRVYPTVVLKNTKLHRMLTEGVYTPLSLEEAIQKCASIKLLFEHYAIPVIRMGLQTTQEISTGNPAVIAGPLHPAFGELVDNYIWLHAILAALEHFPRPFFHTIVIECHHTNLSKLIGNRKINIDKLHSHYPDSKFLFRANPDLFPHEIRILMNFVERKFQKNSLFLKILGGIFREI